MLLLPVIQRWQLNYRDKDGQIFRLGFFLMDWQELSQTTPDELVQPVFSVHKIIQ